MVRAEHGAVRRPGRWLIAISVAFLVAHLTALPRSLEDLDSINFAMGVGDFDVARYQPHPPGYPIYIALGKVSTAVLRAAGVEAPEARGLAIWGVIAGALAVYPLFTFFRRLEGNDRRALAAAIVTVTAPLFWFMANRPLSDVAGLVMVVAVQALALHTWAGLRDPTADARAIRRRTIVTAACAGLAIGMRAQSFLLTLPFVALVLFTPRVPAERRVRVGAIAALGAGILAWAVPLLAASGGLGGYLDALGRQGTEDFADALMLWTQPTPRNLAFALRDTFVLPWATIPLAVVVIGLATIGAGVLVWRSRTACLLLAMSAVPYAVFHLLFHEPGHTKYALPLVPATAYLAVAGIGAIFGALSRATGSLGPGMRTGIEWAAAGALAIASLWPTVPALRQYASAPSPVFQALGAIDARARASGTPPVLVTHRDARRASEWQASQLPLLLQPTERSYEWLAAVKYWLEGGTAPVWFLARAGRTDLALVDPAHRVLVGEYRWPFDTRVFTGGARPSRVDVYDLSSPGWFLGRGWALTPEVAGVTKAGGDGPHRRPSLGYVARRPDAATLVIGGRNLDTSTGGSVRLSVEIDGRSVIAFDQPPGAFLHVLPLAAGRLAGDGAFARLSVTSSNTGAPIEVGLEQFDLQPASAVVWGFDAGWQEPEYDPRREWLWRWTSDASTLRVHNAGQDVVIRLRGESPLVYFAEPPRVTVRAGGQTLATFSPDRDFVQEVRVPAAALAAADGRVVIETDRTWVPDDVSHNGDKRRLGLRLFQVTVIASSRR